MDSLCVLQCYPLSKTVSFEGLKCKVKNTKTSVRSWAAGLDLSYKVPTNLPLYPHILGEWCHRKVTSYDQINSRLPTFASGHMDSFSSVDY